MNFLAVDLMFYAAKKVPSVIPGGEYLSVPWNWFMELGTITQILVLVFGALGFYIVLRLFYKIIEGILALFH